MPVKELFTYPTVSLLAQYIESTQNNDGSEPSQVKIKGAPELDLSLEVEKHDSVVLE